MAVLLWWPAWQERESFAELLRLSWQEEDADPLLSTLADLRQRRLRLEAGMRLLMAYGRCFTHPRPYKLIDLANAAGLSISGPVAAFVTSGAVGVCRHTRRLGGRSPQDSTVRIVKMASRPTSPRA